MTTINYILAAFLFIGIFYFDIYHYAGILGILAGINLGLAVYFWKKHDEGE